MTDLLSPGPLGRSTRLDQVLTALLSTAPELEAAAVVSFDGLPMASALPAGMDEDRVAAMSAALLSLGDRAAQGLGRGDLSQVYVEGEHGTVFLVSADDEAVLVAVANRQAKIGLMLFEVRRAAQAVAAALVADDLDAGIDPYAPLAQAPEAAYAEPEYVEAPAPADYVDYPTQAAPAAAPVAPHAEPAVATAAAQQTVVDYYPPQAPPAPPVAAQPVAAPAAPAAQHDEPAPAQPQPGGPVMVPTGPAGSSLAPDGLAWPQIPATDSGWA